MFLGFFFPFSLYVHFWDEHICFAFLHLSSWNRSILINLICSSFSGGSIHLGIVFRRGHHSSCVTSRCLSSGLEQYWRLAKLYVCVVIWWVMKLEFHFVPVDWLIEAVTWSVKQRDCIDCELKSIAVGRGGGAFRALVSVRLVILKIILSELCCYPWSLVDWWWFNSVYCSFLRVGFF